MASLLSKYSRNNICSERIDDSSGPDTSYVSRRCIIGICQKKKNIYLMLCLLMKLLQKLGLNQLRNGIFKLLTTGRSFLYEGLDWLSTTLQK